MSFSIRQSTALRPSVASTSAVSSADAGSAGKALRRPSLALRPTHRRRRPPHPWATLDDVFAVIDQRGPDGGTAQASRHVAPRRQTEGGRRAATTLPPPLTSPPPPSEGVIEPSPRRFPPCSAPSTPTAPTLPLPFIPLRPGALAVRRPARPSRPPRRGGSPSPGATPPPCRGSSPRRQPP